MIVIFRNLALRPRFIITDIFEFEALDFYWHILYDRNDVTVNCNIRLCSEECWECPPPEVTKSPGTFV